MKPKFSSLIIQLVEVWWMWMENNTKCKDSSLSYKERRACVDACESLIEKEYKIVDQLDSFFNYE